MKQFLLDTRTFLSWHNDNPYLSEEAKTTLRDATSFIHVIAATIREVAIKAKLYKIDIQSGDLVHEISANNFAELLSQLSIAN